MVTRWKGGLSTVVNAHMDPPDETEAFESIGLVVAGLPAPIIVIGALGGDSSMAFHRSRVAFGSSAKGWKSRGFSRQSDHRFLYAHPTGSMPRPAGIHERPTSLVSMYYQGSE